MATALGSSASVSTWGKFRCAYGINNAASTISTHDATYTSGFKSASAGSGLIRITTFGARSVFANQPTFKQQFTPAAPPDPAFNLVYIFGGAGTPSQPATQEVIAELTGETMTLTSGSLVINSGLFTTFGQTDSTPTDLGPITSIGKLTAF